MTCCSHTLDRFSRERMKRKRNTEWNRWANWLCRVGEISDKSNLSPFAFGFRIPAEIASFDTLKCSPRIVKANSLSPRIAAPSSSSLSLSPTLYPWVILCVGSFDKSNLSPFAFWFRIPAQKLLLQSDISFGTSKLFKANSLSFRNPFPPSWSLFPSGIPNRWTSEIQLRKITTLVLWDAARQEWRGKRSPHVPSAFRSKFYEFGLLILIFFV